eukprot:359344-Chlamydomonas_euryale.AAC.1
MRCPGLFLKRARMAFDHPVSVDSGDVGSRCGQCAGVEGESACAAPAFSSRACAWRLTTR